MPTVNILTTKHRNVLMLLAVFWIAFLLFDFSGDFIRATKRGFALEVLRNGLPQLVFVYFAWFCLSTVIGVLAYKWPVIPRTRNLVIHSAIGVTVALFHLAWITISFWIFTPRLVANTNLTAVFSEQFFEWFHFELVIYGLVLVLWTIVLTRKERHAPTYVKRLMIRDKDMQKIVPVKDIAWLEADGNYVRVHTPERTFLKRTSLKHLERQLAPNEFVRLNRSALVSTGQISHIENDHVHLESGETLLLSRRRKTSVLRALDDLLTTKNDH